MAQLIDLGKIRFSYLGDWSSSTTYEYNDVVNYGGNLYVYTFNSSTSTYLPTNTTYWKLMLEGFDYRGNWDDETDYLIGDVVSYGGKVFIATADNSGEAPGSVSVGPKWSKLVDGVQYEGEYAALGEYQVGDIVKYGGILYICIKDSVGNDPTDTEFFEELIPGVEFKGAYDEEVEYKKNDIVSYGGVIYIAKNFTIGNSPTNIVYWDVLTQGFDYKGTYSSVTSYKKNDIVLYGGITYIAKLDNIDTVPTNTTYWSVFAEGIQYGGIYDPLAAYQKNDIVTYGGIVYIAKSDTTGNAPTNTTYWSVLTEGFSFKGVYDDEESYKKNDVVTYDGSTWIALQETTGNEPSVSLFWTVLAPGTFPGFAGNEGYFLSNDGTAVVWTADLAADSLNIGEAFYVGNGAKEFALDEDMNSEPLTNPVATFRFDNDSEDASFAQLAFQNADPTSSTDIIAYMDNGSDSAGWMGMGITGSNFDDATYGITAPGDGYLFLETAGNPGDYTGNMVFATGANGSENKLVFAAGGFDSGLTQMEITPGVNVHIEIPTPSTDPTTGALTVVGGVGVQGDMNIQGNVDIVGTISFGGSGTTVTTQNLAVSDPVIFAGSNNLADGVDLGLVGEYAEDVVDQVSTVSNKALTSNVATITTSSPHGYSIGDVVVIAGVDSVFNGTYVITGVTPTTFSYSKENANITSTVATGTATVTHERRWAGVVRDVSDGAKIKFFQGLTEKPTNTVDFANPSISFAPVEVGNLTANNITSTSGTVSLGGTVNITSAANFTGANVTLGSGTWSGTPTFSGNVVFSGAPSFTGNPTFTGTPSFTGGVRIQELVEDVVDVSQSANSVTLDYSSGNVFWVSNSFSGNFTANVTNAPTDNGRAFTVNVFVTQTATGYIPTTLNINGTGTTIKWAAGVTPTPTSSSGKIDVFSFTIVRRSSSYVALGSANLNF